MSEIVIDLGCEPRGTDRSIEPLVKRFAPKQLLGFDPATSPTRYDLDGTEVVIVSSAAWVRDGTLQLSGADDKATVMGASSARNETELTVPCFDFSDWLAGFELSEVVVKMDIEGAELPVLEKVIADGADDRISLLILEWHDQFFNSSYSLRRAAVEGALRCPVEIWP